jgi:RPA family protein
MTRTTQQQAIAFCESVRPEMVKRYCINTEGQNIWRVKRDGKTLPHLYHASKTKNPKDSRRSWQEMGRVEKWRVWRSIESTGANP